MTLFSSENWFEDGSYQEVSSEQLRILLPVKADTSIDREMPQRHLQRIAQQKKLEWSRT